MFDKDGDGNLTFEELALSIRACNQNPTEKELAELRNREGLERYQRQLTWTRDLVEHLAKVGFQSNLGARPLQRFIETDVVSPLSKWLVEHGGNEACELQLDWHSSSGFVVHTLEPSD